MPEQQPSSQQKSTRSGRQTPKQKLAEYRQLLQRTHDLLLAENNLQEFLSDEKRVPILKSDFSTILKWIKTVERKEEVINCFTNVLDGKEIEIFKESIDSAIIYVNVVIDLYTKEKAALKENKIDVFTKLRTQAYFTLRECRKCIHQALLLFKREREIDF